MMKKLAIVAGLAFVAHTGLAYAGEAKTETKTEETSADGAKTKKTKKSKKAADGTGSSETKTETTK